MIIIFSGPTTIGKDKTWVRITEQLGFTKYIPFTTRHIRQNEQQGIDYRFISVLEFQKMIQENKFLEWDFFDGNYYGTDLSIVEQSKYQDIVLHALARIAIKIRAKLPKTNLIMLLPYDEEVLRHRLHERGYEGHHFAVRYSHYEEERAHASLFDHIVPNAEMVTDFEAETILRKIINGIIAQ